MSQIRPTICVWFSLNLLIAGPPGPPMPRPVLPRERTYFERVVEYVVGDGPANRFALICSSCDSHNGMALKEEFEYLRKFFLPQTRQLFSVQFYKFGLLVMVASFPLTAFRCCYCYYFNPARKQRPQAPRLSPVSGLKNQGVGQNTIKNPETSDSEKNSGSDSSSDEGRCSDIVYLTTSVFSLSLIINL